MAELVGWLIAAGAAWLLYRLWGWALRPYTSGDYARKREYLRYLRLEAEQAQAAHLEKLKEKHGDL